MYLRISQEKKGEGVETLNNHREILTEHALKNGYTYEEFGEVLSGGASDLGKRPELQRLLNEIEKFDAILVVELSRLSRNGLISETVLQYCIDYDKPIITPHYTYDLANNNNDVLTFRFGSLIASQEHALIGKRSKANKMQLAKQGLHVSGGVPYGYRRNSKTKKLEIYEPEAKAVRLIFKLHSEGLGARRIVDTLNAEGYLPQRSDAWNLPSVKRIMKNKVYKGTIVFQDRKRVKENGKYVYKVLDTIEVENAHEPIIESREWEKANRERENRISKFHNYREKPSDKFQTILKDLVFCGKCKRKSLFLTDQNGYITLRACQFQLPNSAQKCDNCGILAKHLEEEIVKKLKERRDKLKEELKKLNELDLSGVEKDLHTRIENVETQIENTKKQQANLIDLAVNGVFSMEEIKDKKHELENTLKELEKSKSSLEKELANIDTVSISDQMKEIISLLDNFEELPIDEQNTVLKKVIKKIHFTRDIPSEIRKLSTRNPKRKFYPFEYEIEYF